MARDLLKIGTLSPSNVAQPISSDENGFINVNSQNNKRWLGSITEPLPYDDFKGSLGKFGLEMFALIPFDSGSKYRAISCKHGWVATSTGEELSLFSSSMRPIYRFDFGKNDINYFSAVDIDIRGRVYGIKDRKSVSRINNNGVKDSNFGDANIEDYVGTIKTNNYANYILALDDGVVTAGDKGLAKIDDDGNKDWSIDITDIHSDDFENDDAKSNYDDSAIKDSKKSCRGIVELEGDIFAAFRETILRLSQDGKVKWVVNLEDTDYDSGGMFSDGDYLYVVGHMYKIMKLKLDDDNPDIETLFEYPSRIEKAGIRSSIMLSDGSFVISGKGSRDTDHRLIRFSRNGYIEWEVYSRKYLHYPSNTREAVQISNDGLGTIYSISDKYIMALSEDLDVRGRTIVGG